MRVATWNVREGVPVGSEPGGTPSAPHQLAALINRHAIDVLALQEVDFDARGQSAVLDEIENNTRLRSIESFPCSPSAFYRQGRSGVAIASAYPMTRHRAFGLPNPGLRLRRRGATLHSFDKGGLTCAIAVQDVATTVVSLHMYPFHMFQRPADDTDFAPVWEALRGELASIRRKRRGPMIVAGDFNTPDRTLLAGTEAPALGSAVDGQPTHRGYSADDILYSAAHAPAAAEVVETFSDHRLCFVDICVG